MASGNDKDLKIGITADTKDADKAKDALEAVKKAGEDLGKGTAEGAKAAAEGLKQVEAEAKKVEQAIDAVAAAEKKSGEEAAETLKWRKRAAETLAAAEASLADPKSFGALRVLDVERAVINAGGAAAAAAREAGASWEEAAAASKKAEEATSDYLASLKPLTDEEAGVIDLRKKHAAATEDAAKSTKKLTEEGKELKTMELGLGLAQGAEVVGKLARGLNEAAGSLREVNPEMAETVQKSAKLADGLSSILNGAATGLLMSGGNPVGAIIGGVTAAVAQLGVAWAESMADAEKATQGAVKKTEEASKHLQDMVSRMRDVNAEAERRSFQGWVEGIEDGADAMARQNEELERNLRLSKEKDQGQARLEHAQTNQRIAAVQASDLAPDEKVRQINALKEEQAKRDSDRNVAGFNGEVAAEEARLKIKQEESLRAQKLREKAEERLKAEEAHQAEIDAAQKFLKNNSGEDGRVSTLSQATANVEKSRQREQELDSMFSGATLLSTGKAVASLATFGAYDYDANKEREKRQQEREKAEGTLAELQSKIAEARRIAGQASSVEDARKEAEKARADESKAIEASTQSYHQVEEVKKQRDFRVSSEQQLYGVERGTRAIEGKSQEDQAKARMLQDEKRKQDQAAQKKKQEETKAEQAEKNNLATSRDIEGVADQAVPTARKLMGDRAAGALNTIGNALHDGASSKELEALTNALEVLAKKAGENSADGLAIQKLQERMRDLEAKLIKNPNLTHT
jgi:colicin import membrane protein